MRRIERYACLAALFAAVFCADAFGRQMPTRTYACPLCGSDAWGVIAVSSRAHGLTLDLLRENGLSLMSYPRRCRECRYEFIVLTPEPPEQTAMLREYVFSDEYKSIPDWVPRYFFLAKLEQKRRKSDFVVGCHYVYASSMPVFRRTGDQFHGMRAFERNCFRLALRHFAAHVPEDDAPLYEKLLPMYFRVELNRRLGNFSGAAECLEKAEQMVDQIPPTGDPLSDGELDRLIFTLREGPIWYGEAEAAPRLIPPAADLVMDDRILPDLLRALLTRQRAHIAARDSSARKLEDTITLEKNN